MVSISFSVCIVNSLGNSAYLMMKLVLKYYKELLNLKRIKISQILHVPVFSGLRSHISYTSLCRAHTLTDCVLTDV